MALTCFDISYRDGAYYVSVPNYNGGRVWTDDYVHSLREAHNEALVELSVLWEERVRTLLNAKDHLVDLKQIKEMLEQLTRV